jgi:hypothetical protein
MKVSRYHVEEWRKELEEKAREERARANQLIGTDAVSYSSDDEVRFVLYGVRSRKMVDVDGELAKKGERKNTKVYKDWYTAWKNGKIIDSGLRWVPEVYAGDSFNPKFLEYLKLQYGLHKNASSKDRQI